MSEPIKAELLYSSWDRVAHYLDGEIRTVHEGYGPYYGVTWDDKHFYIAARCQGQSGGEAIFVLDKDFMELYQYRVLTDTEHGVKQLHQILYWDGWVYITDTKHDRVLAWDRDRTHKAEIVYAGGPEVADYSHINSLWTDGIDFWVTEAKKKRLHCLGVERVCGAWRAESRSVIGVGSWCHNGFKHGDMVHAIRSGPGAHELFSWNLKDGTTTLQALDLVPNPYMVGIVRTSDRWFFGAAAILGHTGRVEGEALIGVFDSSVNKLGTIDTEMRGQVHDIRVMNEIDYAHHGMLAPGRGDG